MLAIIGLSTIAGWLAVMSDQRAVLTHPSCPNSVRTFDRHATLNTGPCPKVKSPRPAAGHSDPPCVWYAGTAQPVSNARVFWKMPPVNILRYPKLAVFPLQHCLQARLHFHRRGQSQPLVPANYSQMRHNTPVLRPPIDDFVPP